MSKKVIDISFNMMPKVDSMVAFGNRILMYDNLDSPVDDSSLPAIDNFLSHLPMRVSFVVIVVCIKGGLYINCKTESFMMQESDCLILVPGTECHKMEMFPDSTYIAFALSDDTYVPESSFENATYVARNFTSPKCVRLDKEVVESGVTIYRQMKSNMSAGGRTVSDDLVKAYIMVFAGLAANSMKRWMKENEGICRSNGESILKEFLIRVETDHRAHRDVAYYALQAGLSPKYFAKVIFSNSGKHPLDWIRQHVIRDAKVLLKDKGKTVDQICGILNFSSRSQFNRYFKDVTGMTPVEYAKS